MATSIATTLDLKDFVFKPGDSVPKCKPRIKRLRPKPNGRFLMGPIDWNWITAAALLPGRALHAAIVIQFLAGLAKSQTITLSSQELSRLGVRRTSGYRALERLQIAGLIHVERGPGKLPRVTINLASQ
jgi:hypothetical protein